MKQKFLALILSVSSLLVAYPPAGTLHDIAVDFQGVFTVLNECCSPTSSLQADFTGIFTALAECCNDLEATITDCCQTLEQDFAFTWTILDEFETGGSTDSSGVSTVLNELSKNFCSPTFILQSDVGTAGFMTPAPGVYKLGENITFSPTGPNANAITIAHDNTLLDLQCFMLSHGNSEANINGVFVGPNTKVMVQNGGILDFTNGGVVVDAGADSVQVKNLKFDGNNRGVQYAGSGASPVTNALLKNCDIKASATGVDLQNVEKSRFINLALKALNQAGIDSKQSFTNTYQNIAIKGVTAQDGSAYGIRLADGGGSSLEALQIAGVSTRSTDSTQVAAGIQINENEQMDKLIDAQICTISTVDDARPAGIDMLYSFTSVAPTNAALDFIFDTVNAVQWTNDGRYLAVGAGSGGLLEIRVYEFARLELVEVASATSASDVTSVDWSPDGRYLAVINGAGLNVYEFDGTSLGTPVTVAITGANACRWSHDGRYVAAVANTAAATEIAVYEFTGAALVASGTTTFTRNVLSVDWAPGDEFIVVGTQGAIGLPAQVQVYSFTGTAVSLIDTADMGTGNFAEVNSVGWSPNGNYIAAGANSTFSAPFQIQVFSFDGTNLIVNASETSATAVNAVAWSPDSRYVAAGNDTAPRLSVYEFDGGSLQTPITASVGAQVNSISWHPTGAYIATGGVTLNNVQGRIFTAFQFPAGHTIKDNLVSAVNGPALVGFSSAAVSTGSGIQASSEENFIAGNNAYDNDSNYIFIAFERFQEFLQNINVRNEFPNRLSNVSVPPL